MAATPIVFLAAGGGIAGPWPVPFLITRAYPVIRNRLRWVAAGLTIGLMIGIAIGIESGLSEGLAVGLATWAALGLIGTLQPWEHTADLQSPHRAVHGDLVVGLLAGPTFGLVTGALYGILTDIATELAFGLVFGLVFGLAVGLILARAAVRYGIGLACAAVRGRLPIRLAAFCRWACDAGLLRVAGAAYQFRHRELQNWLIRADTVP